MSIQRGISLPKIVQFLALDSGQSVDDTMVQQASVQSLQLHLNRRDGKFGQIDFVSFYAQKREKSTHLARVGKVNFGVRFCESKP